MVHDELRDECPVAGDVQEHLDIVVLPHLPVAPPLDGEHRAGGGVTARRADEESATVPEKTDLGLLSEYAYDERGKEPTTTSLYDNDLFLGMRLTPNDTAGTQFLAGFAQDLEVSTNTLLVETSRRFGSHWKLTLEAWFFLHAPPRSLIYSLRDDDFVRLQLAYYF